jgi:hypothetical protein
MTALYSGCGVAFKMREVVASTIVAEQDPP